MTAETIGRPQISGRCSLEPPCFHRLDGIELLCPHVVAVGGNGKLLLSLPRGRNLRTGRATLTQTMIPFPSGEWELHRPVDTDR